MEKDDCMPQRLGKDAEEDEDHSPTSMLQVRQEIPRQVFAQAA